jgi:hypothetical protein
MLKHLFFYGVLLAAIPFLFINCSTQDSEDVRTSGIYATFWIYYNDGSPKAEATFYPGDGISTSTMELSDGDTISVRYGGNTYELSHHQLVGHYYQKTGITYTEDAEYTFIFHREGEGDYEATVTAPKLINITSPGSGSISRYTTTTLEWTPAVLSGEIYLSVSGHGKKAANPTEDDSYSKSDIIADDGSYDLSGDWKDPSKLTDLADITGVEISLERTNTGTMPSGLNGTVKAHARDYVEGITWDVL